MGLAGSEGSVWCSDYHHFILITVSVRDYPGHTLTYNFVLPPMKDGWPSDALRKSIHLYNFKVRFGPGIFGRVFSIVLSKLFRGCSSYYDGEFRHCIKTLGVLIGSGL